MSSPSFEMMMEDGSITVLDSLDDVLCTHGVGWPKGLKLNFKLKRDGSMSIRYVWVYCYLGQIRDYYDNCLIRRTQDERNDEK